MALASGTRVGAYEVVAAIGAGGMGEVYRARDAKLGRDVALKVLPDSFASDPERRGRFEREAQLLASLNHPNIAAIYGFEDATDVHALVLELIEGPTLADRIGRGAVPTDEALPIALQMCDALEAAHNRGIIHRDLKPANIKLGADGRVKVLDFGLAKLADPAAGLDDSSRAMSMSPTLTVHATTGGVLLGTVAYMSPEQARGKPVDKRADIWAFGCVLFEMLTGRQAFDAGETVSDGIAAILKNEPLWSALPASTPPPLLRLLRRSLQKDPQQRLRDIGDARLDIVDARNAGGDGSAGAPRASTRAGRVAWSAAGLLAFTTAAAVTWALRPVPPPATLRVELSTPPTTDPASIALSPDGRTIVYAATADGISRLWTRSLETGVTRQVSGTEGGVLPFWSPDGLSLGFFADGHLKRVELAGGVPRVFATTLAAGGGAWGRDGTILYSPNSGNGPLYRVPAAGGELTRATKLGPSGGHRSPQWLPDGRHFLYTASGDANDRGVFLGALDGSDARRLVDGDAARCARSGALLFVRQGTLFAQPFDERQLALTGEPVAMTEQGSGEPGIALSTAANADSIAYRSGGSPYSQRQFVWVDRSGAEIAKVGEPGGAANPALSPDGRRIAFQRGVNGNTDIWLVDLARGVLSRLTSDPALDTLPIWSPDGGRILFSSRRGVNVGLYEKGVDDQRAETPFLTVHVPGGALDWSRDGQFILFRNVDPRVSSLWALPLSGDRKAFPVVSTAFDMRNGQFSPDGHWLAYESNESGRFEIYVQSFPEGRGKERISTNGGAQVRWRSDGRELFFVALDGRLMAVPIRIDDARHTLEPGTPVRLFDARVGEAVPNVVFYRQQYVVAADGQRFLLNRVLDETSTAPITLVLNWRLK